MNGLFYDPFTDQLLDYVGGVKDVENRIMRMIGDPTKRIIEDPVRSLRAVRLSHKLHFTIDPELKLAIKNNSEELLKCAAPRRREEWLKMLKLHNPITAFLELYDLDLMKYVLPTWQKYLDNMDFSYLFFDHWRSFLALTQDPEFHDLDALQEETPRESFHYYLPFYWAAHKTFQEMKIKLDFNEYENLFKVEMGLFKSEMAILEQILELSKQLDRVDSFKKRGPRRQRAFVLQPTFEEALKICYLEQNLSPLDLQYWLGWLQQSLTDPAY